MTRTRVWKLSALNSACSNMPWLSLALDADMGKSDMLNTCRILKSNMLNTFVEF